MSFVSTKNVSELKQARGSLLKATDRGLKLFFRHFSFVF